MTIYEPSDDTELLLKAICKYSSKTVLEIGIGSGIILQKLAHNNIFVVGLDISSESVFYVSSHIKKLKLEKNVDVVLGSGPSMFASHNFDLVVFNPPYLPHDNYTDTTTDGGPTGLELTHKWLELSLDLIKPSGKIVFLQSSLTPLNDYINILRKSIIVNIIMKKKLFFEELFIIEVMPGK